MLLVRVHNILVVFEKNRVSNYTRVARRIPLLNMDI